MMRRLLHITLLLIISTCATSQVEVYTALSKDSIGIGEQVEFVLGITYPIELEGQIEWPIIADTLTTDIEILQTGKIDSSLAEVEAPGDFFKQELTLLVTSFETGFFPIPPLSFKVAGESYAGEAVLLVVGEPTIVDEENFRDIKEIRSIEYTLVDFLKEYGLWILLGVIALALIGVSIWLVANRKKDSQPDSIPEIPMEEAHVIALRELKKLKADAVWQQGNTKGYYSRLTDTVRTYIEHRYQVPAMEETTDQIIRDLKALGIDATLVGKMGSMLRMSDLAKFAKSKPLPEDNENAFMISETFVKATMKKDESE